MSYSAVLLYDISFFVSYIVFDRTTGGITNNLLFLRIASSDFNGLRQIIKLNFKSAYRL